MPSPSQSSTPSLTLGELLQRRLREIKRSPEELAAAVEVPPEYITELIAGSRRPPRPERTDVYERMTTFLRLGRSDLAACARAEWASRGAGGAPTPGVRRLLLKLCEPRKARTLEQRRQRKGNTELVGLLQRLLDVAQGSVRRILDDQIGLRLAAAEHGCSYLTMRHRVLEFLDATPATLTAEALAEFVEPRIARWDVDLRTGVLRVVLRAQEPRDRSRRAPKARTGLIGGTGAQRVVPPAV